MNFRNIAAATAFMLALPTASMAQTCPEIEGFGDLEGLPVYQGACLFGAEDAGFVAHSLPVGPMKGRALGDALALEGQLQRRLYVAPEGASAFDLFSNYRKALTDAGYEALFECIGRACGSNNALLGKLVIYGPDRTLRNLGAASEFALYIDGDEHFLAARSADGLRHVAVYVAQNQDRPISGEAAGRAAVHIDLMSTDQLQNNMVDAAAMAKGITDDGRIALDNVYFEFGTAKLTPEAGPALAEMVKLLVDNPALKVYIVGHTDWVGDAGANQTLSNQRAQAVVDALVAAGVDGARLGAAGMGMFSPRASNATEAGRALNRRVELVERPE
jgi:OOP family OmpA-OmpF porin